LKSMVLFISSFCFYFWKNLLYVNLTLHLELYRIANV
jgi:hypothetical protein